MNGLYLLWWVQERQLSPALVAAVLAAGDFALMILELPTGWFADRFVHRASLIIGSLVQVAGMLCCWLGADVPSLFGASFLIALGDAFRSGADEALLYRTCVAMQAEQDFQRIEARTQAVQQLALVGLILAGGVVVSTWGFAAGWIAETALCVAGVAIAFAFVEPPSPEPLEGEHCSTVGGRRSWPRAIVQIVLPAAFVGAAANTASFLLQTSGDREPGGVTLLVAAIAFGEAAGAFAAGHMASAAGGIVRQVAVASVGMVLVGIAIVLPPTAHVVAVALAFLAGVAYPLRSAAIQRLAADDARARAASLASACDMACSTLALSLAGVWRSRRRG
jgi:hypothetical protein